MSFLVQFSHIVESLIKHTVTMTVLGGSLAVTRRRERRRAGRWRSTDVISVVVEDD